MKADKYIATYRRMRTQPLWRLLASGNGPTVIGLFQSNLYEKERSLPASILFERLTRDLEELRAQGDDFPQTAQAYVAKWLSEGYLERRFPSAAQDAVGQEPRRPQYLLAGLHAGQAGDLRGGRPPGQRVR